jgi:biopolymer transport protein ExbD/biopolymer transport protein ExbB/TolQ
MLALLQLECHAESASASLVSLILGTDWITKGVLVLLIGLSLLSWAIMFAKWRAFTVAEANGRKFVHEFERTRSIDDAASLAQRSKPSAFTAVFARAVQFLNDTKPALGATTDRTARLSGSQVEALRLVLDAESGKEREELGRFITWLATVGSVSPLIGLLGTVLGVMSAFVGIIEKGTATLPRWRRVLRALVGHGCGAGRRHPRLVRVQLVRARVSIGSTMRSKGWIGIDRTHGARRADLARQRGRRRGERMGVNGEINVVSLIDVMMLLMVIFMITAPIMQGGVDVKVPKADVRPLDAKSGLIVTIDRRGQIYADDVPLTEREFIGSVKTLADKKGGGGVMLRADKDVRYEIVLRVVAAIRDKGLDIGLVGEPVRPE